MRLRRSSWTVILCCCVCTSIRSITNIVTFTVINVTTLLTVFAVSRSRVTVMTGRNLLIVFVVKMNGFSVAPSALPLCRTGSRAFSVAAASVTAILMSLLTICSRRMTSMKVSVSFVAMN